jgi:FAD/FMN-containing dehydrogenase
VLGIEVVLPDGRVLDDLRRVRKDNTGYALRHLFLGGEGTLGVITGAALKLAPALRARETASLSVPSPAAALALLDRLVSNGAELIGFELIGRWPLELVRRHGARARLPFALESPWYVLLELGTAAAGADLRTPLETTLAAAIGAGEAGEAVIAESEEQRASLWYLREVMPECNRAEAPSVSADTAVPVSAVPSFLAQVEAAFAARWPGGKLIAVGHAGDGNVHISLQAPRGTPREVWLRNAEAIEDTVNRIAVAHGGSFSAEHGIGQSKRHAMAALRDPVALHLMRAIKAAIDPRGIMNPGKMLPG